MTRTTCLSTLSSAALLAAVAAGFGCGSSSTIDTGTGGTGAGGKIVGAGGGAVIIGTGGIGTGGRIGTGGAPAMDAGGTNMCVAGTPCTAGFTCSIACTAGGMPGTRGCTCGANGMLNCPAGGGTCMVADAGPPPPMPDAGANMCVVGTPCTMGFTCREACMTAAGAAGTRGCICNNAGMVNCPGGGGACMVADAGPPPPMPDAGANMCVVGTPCTMGFTCREACMAGGGVMGTRGCTCNNAGRVNCPVGAGTCMVADAGPPPPMPDAGVNMCVVGTPCTMGFTCREACMAGGGVPGTRGCTCNNAGRVNCPGGGGTCLPDDAGARPVDAPVGG